MILPLLVMYLLLQSNILYLAISQPVLDSFGVNFISNCQKSSPNIYWFCLWRGMGYGLLQLYGLWSGFPCKPTWWTEKPKRFHGVWGTWAMGYKGVNCVNWTDLALVTGHLKGWIGWYFTLKKKVSSKTYFLHCAAYTYYKTIPSTKYASTGVETASRCWFIGI